MPVSQPIAVPGKKNRRFDSSWELLGGKDLVAKKPTTAIEFYNAIKKGLPKSAIDHLAKSMQLPMTKMATLLNLSYKTLTRKTKTELLDPSVSSHAYEIAETIARGLAIFEDQDKLIRWLNKPNRALNGAVPFDLLDTATGIKLVNQILGRIEEGVYS